MYNEYNNFNLPHTTHLILCIVFTDQNNINFSGNNQFIIELYNNVIDL